MWLAVQPTLAVAVQAAVQRAAQSCAASCAVSRAWDEDLRSICFAGVESFAPISSERDLTRAILHAVDVTRRLRVPGHVNGKTVVLKAFVQKKAEYLH